MTTDIELRKLAEAVAGEYDQMKHTTEENTARARSFQVFSFTAANPATILSLLDRLEKAEKDAGRYRAVMAMSNLDLLRLYNHRRDLREGFIDAAMEATK